MRTIKFLFLGLFLLANFPAFSGTTYYVRSTGGLDSNDGLTANTAFLTLTKMFSGTPALVDGDIINISGTFDYFVSYKILKNITIQGTDKSSSIIRGSAGAVKNCFIVGSSSPVSTPTVVIENVTFQDFDYWSDGASNNGGVINVIGASSLTCRKVVFKNNQAYGGGAVNINAGTGLFEDCYFLNNKAKQRTGAANSHGGAIAVSTSGTGSISITIDRCLFEGNTAENSGPSMRFITAGTGNATLLVQNSTFTGNIVKLPSTTTTSGILTLSIAATGTSDVKLVNNTIAYNSSELSGSTANGIYIGGVTDKVVAINNIIYSNTRPDNADYSITTATNIKLKESRNNITSQAFDFDANTATSASFNNVFSVSANNLKLAATLADNGGETKTLAINSNSVAKNTGYATGFPSVDQRGITRHTLDKGAYEYVTYRSKATGNWGSTTSWESTGDNTTWADVTVIPTVNVAGTINIQNTHEITVAANATSPALTINSGGKLTLNSSYNLAVTGNLNIQSDGSNGTGTFVDKSTNGLTVSGTSTVNQNLSSPLRSWYMSSPVTGAKPTGMDRIKYYNEAANSWPTLYNSSVSTPVPYGENSFTTGKGYLVVPLSGNSIAFTGALNAGEKSITLLKTDGAAKTGFNLIGNPYPSYLDWKAVYDYTTGSEVYPNRAVLEDGTMWYRTKVEVTPATDPVTYEYKFWTVNGLGVGSVSEATKYIAPMQAFWVRAKTIGSELLTLNKDMLSHGEATNKLLKAPVAVNASMPLVRIQVSNGANTDEAVIYFSADASNERDVYDAPKMSNENAAIPEIYTMLGTEQLVINGMNTIPLDQEIGLGFVAGDATSFSLKANEVSNLPADVKLILKDNVTNAETDVTDGVTAYAFTPLATSDNRFSVIFRSAGAVTVLNSQNDNMLLAYSTQKNQITLVYNDAMNIGSTASVYNAVGQKLMSKQLFGSITLLNGNFNPGVYVIKVNNLSKKVVVK